LLVPGKVNNKGRCFSFKDFRGSHLTQRESKLIEKKEKTNTFSPSAVQRETAIDTADPVYIPRDFTVGHKRLVWA
jgi:hypothetical protein